jgi:hypothetical protein
VLEEENNRLKRLLIATTLSYIFSLICSYYAQKLLFDANYLGLFLDHSWLGYVLLFLSFVWVPLSIFLFIQAYLLKKQILSSTEILDKSIANISLLLPMIILFIYIATRIFYG